MNRYFTNPIFTIHNFPLRFLRPLNYANEHFLRKKLTDYYYSRIIPDFYYESKLNWKNSPYIQSSRYLISLLATFFFYYFFFKRGLRQNLEKTKKYKFDFYSKSFVEYERQMILSNKNSHKKMFF